MSKRVFLTGLLATVLTLAASGVIAPASAAAGVHKPPPSGSLDPAVLQESLDQVTAAGVPGAFTEVRDGRWRWSGASGVADLATGAPTKPWLQHRVGSITKTFVATTMLQLVGEGRLALDEPIGRWLPELDGSEVGEQVTVRMLLNHTSGIGDYDTALIQSLEDVVRVGETIYTPQELVEIGLAEPRTGAPGEAHSYSNTNYVLAGLIIERVTGRDAEQEIDRRIIRRLGLRHTYFPGDERVIRGPHAAAYFAPLGAQDLSVSYMSWVWMAGDLVSTTADINTFFRALLGGRLLAPAELAQMRTTVPFDPEHPEWGGYGLGIYWTPTPCGEVWGHDGVVIGHVIVSLHAPDGRTQVSTAVNVSHYWVPDEATPIDVAYWDQLVSGLCPDAVVTRSETPPRLPPLLDR